MQEFSSISVSSYEAGSLSDQLTEQSRQGWDVVAIIPTGSTITAYLSRAAIDDAAPADDVTGDITGGDAQPAAVVTEPAVEPPPEPDPITEPAGWGAAPDPEPAAAEPVVAAAPAAAEQTTETTTSTAAAAPAGWYADPSSRFELRYWDGSQWTEHVSRSGQQYTDPPVA